MRCVHVYLRFLAKLQKTLHLLIFSTYLASIQVSTYSSVWTLHLFFSIVMPPKSIYNGKLPVAHNLIPASSSCMPSSSHSAGLFTELSIQSSIESSAERSIKPSIEPSSSLLSVRAPSPITDGAFSIRWGALQYNNKCLSDAHYYMRHKRTTNKTKKSWIWAHGANIESE